jgi:putative transposase
LPRLLQHLFQEVYSPAVLESTLDRWRQQYGGMKAAEAKRLKELEDENRRLKHIVADQALDIQMLKHITEGNW